MFVLNILCHNLSGTNRPEFGYELVKSGYETSESGYERSMDTKRLVTET